MTREELYELKNKRANLLTEGNDLLAKKDLEAHKAKMAEVDKRNDEILSGEKQLAEEGRFQETDERAKGLLAAQQAKKQEEQRTKTVDEIRGSNEYARAFAKAMRRGASVKAAGGDAELSPLLSALNESGGNPVGSDGGFLVPIDVDNRIQRLEKEYLDLSRFFRVEQVTAPTGWRVIETEGGEVLPKVAELGTIGKDDKPKFRRYDYNVEKYGDRIQISSELMDDNAAGLLSYVVDWFGPKYIKTKNALLLPFLQGLTTVVPLTAGKEALELKKALIKTLNTAQSRGAVILTNQTGFAEMDGWADANGRPLLVPNPADPVVTRFQGRQVAYGDDAELPCEEETVKVEGKADTVKTTIPLYVGKFDRLGTLFVRKGIELATTNVGGDAWATDSTELRAICRMGASLVDKTAAFKATIAVAAAAAG